MVENRFVKIDILNHADFCGEFRGDKHIPGLRKFYQAIESVRSKNPDNTLLLDAGDEINRLLWYGKDVLDGMALIQTDAWALGNHEFDRGMEELENNIEYIHSKIPVLCANVTYKGTNNLIRNVVPYVVFEKCGIKIGVIGLTTEYTEKMVSFPYFEPYQTHPAYDTIAYYTKELRDSGVEIIVVLCHIGATSKDGVYSGELIDLAKKIKDLNIDLLIGGHQNGDIYWEYDGVLINKGGFSGKSLLHTELYFDTEKRCVVDKKAEVIYPISEKFNRPNEKIDSFVDKILEPLSLYFNDVLAIAKEDVYMDYNKESAQGNLFADAVREKSCTDFSYFNTTSCGPFILEGPVTRYSIKQAIYFDEHIYTSTITGKEIRRLFEIVHNPEIYNNNFNLYFSGLKITIDMDREFGHKVVSVQHLDGTEVSDDEVLTVSTSEYMASGGNDTREIANARHWQKYPCLIHDAIKDYLLEVKEIDNSIDHRYTFIGKPMEFDEH